MLVTIVSTRKVVISDTYAAIISVQCFATHVIKIAISIVQNTFQPSV